MMATSTSTLIRTATAPWLMLFLGLTVCSAPATAQDEDYKSKATNQRTSGAAGASERARQKRDSEQQASVVVAKYPEATREEPGVKASMKGGRALKQLLELYDAQKYGEVVSGAEALAADASANAYDKSFAYQLAANASGDMGKNDAQSAAYFEKALQAAGLDNNGHYQVMYNLATVQYGAEEYARSLATLDRFMAETRTQTPEAVQLKAATLVNLERPAEAAALYESVLSASPDDKKTLMNAVALHQQTGEHDRASALLESAQRRGLLTEAKEYRTLYVSHINGGKLAQAISTIDAGIAKGVIMPSPELARDYQVIAQNAYAEGDARTAIQIFERAGPMAEDGTAYLNLAKALSNEGRTAESKQAAQQALDKGVRNPEEARKLLAR